MRHRIHQVAAYTFLMSPRFWICSLAAVAIVGLCFVIPNTAYGVPATVAALILGSAAFGARICSTHWWRHQYRLLLPKRVRRDGRAAWRKREIVTAMVLEHFSGGFEFVIRYSDTSELSWVNNGANEYWVWQLQEQLEFSGFAA